MPIAYTPHLLALSNKLCVYCGTCDNYAGIQEKSQSCKTRNRGHAYEAPPLAKSTNRLFWEIPVETT